MYAGCPLSWASKVQMEMALSTTKVDYITLSIDLREQIPVLELLNEVVVKGNDLKIKHPIIHCRAFEDNSIVLEMAKLPKKSPQNQTFQY